MMSPARPSARALTLTSLATGVGLLLSLISLLALAVRTGRILERTEMVALTVQRIEADQSLLIRERQITIAEWSVWRKGVDDRLAEHDAELRPASFSRRR